MTMANYGPILKTPRIIRSDNEVPMKRSGSMTPSNYPYDGSRRTPVSYVVGPRSRSSYGYSVSEIGRDGSLVTRNVSRPSYSSHAESTQYYSTSTPPTMRPLYTKRGRSMSIEPVSYYYAAPSQSSLYSSVDHPVSSVRSRRLDYSTSNHHMSPIRGISYSTYDHPVSPVRGISYSTYDRPVSPIRRVSHGTYDRSVSLARGISYSTYDRPVSPVHGISYSTYDRHVSPVKGISYSTYDRHVSPVKGISYSTYDRHVSPVRRVSYSTFDSLTSPVRRVAHSSYQPGHHTPVSYYYTVPTYTETYSSANRSASPVSRASISYQSIPSMPRQTRRESISQPYYTVNNSSPLGSELVIRRTSISSAHQPAAHAKAVRSFSVASPLSPEGKVLAESNVVTRRTSVQREELEDFIPAEAGRRTSHYRSGTPSMAEQQKRFSHQHEIGKRSSMVRSVASRDNRRSSSISRPSSVAVTLTSRGSLSLPPAGPIRKISVVSKSPDENESASSIKIVEVEGIQPVKKLVFENAEQKNGPRRNEVYEDLKKRTLQAKDRLGRHRMMLDRYLPVNMGPEPDVAFEIQNKYGELVERLPFIERRNPAETEEEEEKENVTKLNIVKPYSPASVKSFSSPYYNVHVPSSFTPTISDTRKRARDVLCRVKGDPEYFNYH